MASALPRTIRCCCCRLLPSFSQASAPRSFTTTAPNLKKAFPPRPRPPPDSEIQESYLKGSGPGGQKINKTNSAVQLKHIPTGIVVKCQATRSRDQNRKQAREILAQRIDDHINGDASRTAVVAEMKRKRAASAAKKSRRKYKALEEEDGEATDEDIGDKLEAPESRQGDDTGEVDGAGSVRHRDDAESLSEHRIGHKAREDGLAASTQAHTSPGHDPTPGRIRTN